MAIAYDNGAVAYSTAGVTSLTTASFAVAGSNRLLVGGIGAGAGTPVAPTGMKWGGSGGTALTQAGTTQTVNAFNKLSLFRLIAPSASTTTGYGNWPSAQDETGVLFASYTGIDQTTPFKDLGGSVFVQVASGDSSSPSITVTTTAGDTVVALAWMAFDHPANATWTSSNTIRQKIEGANLGYESAVLLEQVASGTSTVLAATSSDTFGQWVVIAAILNPASAGSPPTLSSATPSGTIGTSTTANIGATTTNGTAGSNTLYTVRATTDIFTGVTATQVKAGQNASGNTTGVTALNAAVTTTAPSVSQTSLTASTLYYYAEAQEDSNGLSNVLTGSFTTAAAATGAKLLSMINNQAGF